VAKLFFHCTLSAVILKIKDIDMQLKNKVAIITGASKGIGRKLATELAKNGVHIAISARSKNLLEDLTSEIRDLGVEVLYFTGDMSIESEIKKFIKQTINRFQRLDILINNAGIGHFENVIDLSTEKWDEMFNLNMRGLFIMTREALAYLRKAGEAVIVNLASLAGKNTFTGGAGYAATKHAVLGFSRCLMLEERQHGIRVITICPGSVSTSFSSKEKDEQKDKRKIQPEDIASTIIHAIQMPQRAMISEIDIRPTNP
jgi:3-oxoacyl-[acyl-carrier protein] reductase